MMPILVSTIPGSALRDLIVPIETREQLFGLQPDMQRLKGFSESPEVGVSGIHVVTMDTGEEGVLALCRHFAPRIGIPEDPATGVLARPTVEYIALWNKLVGNEQQHLTLHQGKDPASLSEIHVLLDRPRNPVVIKVGGKAILSHLRTVEV